MCGVFKQACSVSFESAALCCGLSGEFRLNLGRDFNGNRHGVPFRVTVLFFGAKTLSYGLSGYRQGYYNITPFTWWSPAFTARAFLTFFDFISEHRVVTDIVNLSFGPGFQRTACDRSIVNGPAAGGALGGFLAGWKKGMALVAPILDFL
jgi:hypothetical protein